MKQFVQRILKSKKPDEKPVRDIKFAFLTLLIIGAAAMGLTSAVALLVGGFNDYIGRALLSVVVLLTHALLALAIISTVTTAYLRRSLIASTILTVIAANIVTLILGIWRIIPATIAWHLLGLYFLLIGGAFAVTWFLRSRIGVKQSDGLVTAAVILTLAFIGTLTPWVVTEHPAFPAIYYRAIGAIVILLATLLIIARIVRHIYRSRGTGYVAISAFKGLSALVIVIYSTLGATTIFVWFAGIIGFSLDAVGYKHPEPSYSAPYDDGQSPYDSTGGSGSEQFDGSGNSY